MGPAKIRDLFYVRVLSVSLVNLQFSLYFTRFNHSISSILSSCFVRSNNVLSILFKLIDCRNHLHYRSLISVQCIAQQKLLCLQFSLFYSFKMIFKIFSSGFCSCKSFSYLKSSSAFKIWSLHNETLTITELLRRLNFILKMIFSFWFIKALPTVECFAVVTASKSMRATLLMRSYGADKESADRIWCVVTFDL